MSVATYQKLKTVQGVLYVALGLLVLATVASLLSSVFYYLIAVAIALALLAFHWFTRHNTRMVKWRKFWAMTLPVFTVLAPIIYIILVLFVFSDATKWIYFMRFCSVILPLLLLMYAIYSLQKLIDQL